MTDAINNVQGTICNRQLAGSNQQFAGKNRQGAISDGQGELHLKTKDERVTSSVGELAISTDSK